MLEPEHIYLEELGIYFTYDKVGPKKSREVEKKIEQYHRMIHSGRSIKIKDLNKTIRKYPEVPQFKNYLANIYTVNRSWENLRKVAEELLTEHPDYFFGRINLALYYYETNHLDKIPELLEDSLVSFCPDKEIFHVSEVNAYYSIYAQYYNKVEQVEKENACLDILLEINPEHPLAALRNLELIEETLQMLENEEKYERIVEDLGYDKSIQTKEAPTFTHKEILNLYEYGYDIPLDILEIILLLPRESLIKDLEEVLEDSIRRYEFFVEKCEEEGWNFSHFAFAEHALYLLIETKASDSIAKVFRLLRQGYEFLYFWYSDSLDRIFAETLYSLDHESLEKYKQFILEPNNYSFARLQASNVMAEVYFSYPNRKEEVINLYADIYTHFLHNPDDTSLIDTELIGFLVLCNAEMNAIELEAIFKKLWDKGWIPESLVGDWEEIRTFLHQTEDKVADRIKFHSLLDRYEVLKNESEGNYPLLDLFADFVEENSDEFVEDDYSDDWEPYSLSTPIIKRITPKIGRNEPCPCGSGKKYKKCCLGK